MKVLLVGDQMLVLKGLVSILEVHDTMEACWEATSNQQAMNLINSENPDVVVIDFHMGKEDGLEVITEAKKQGHDCKFVILTYSKDTVSFAMARAMDVDGYISMEAYPEELIYALEIIHRGRKYYDPEILDLLLHGKQPKQMDQDHAEQLTMKEKEVLENLGMGLSNKQISKSLFITENTVKKHVSQILSKLNLGDRTHAALYANEKGLAHYTYKELV